MVHVTTPGVLVTGDMVPMGLASMRVTYEGGRVSTNVTV